MRPEKSELIASFAPSLKQLGFKKKGASWFRADEAAVQVVNIQQSQFGPAFFVNLGVSLFSLGGKESPAEYECHIRARLNHFGDSAHIGALLDFQKREFSHADAGAALAILLEQGLPWLQKCSTESGLSQEAYKGRFLLHHSIQGRYRNAQPSIKPDGPASGGAAG